MMENPYFLMDDLGVKSPYFRQHPHLPSRPRELRAPAASIKGDSCRPSVQTLTSAPLAKASNIALKVGQGGGKLQEIRGMLVEHLYLYIYIYVNKYIYIYILFYV